MSLSITFGDRSASELGHVRDVPRAPHEEPHDQRDAMKRPAEDSVLLTVAVADSRRTYTYVIPETAHLDAAVTSITSAPAGSLASHSYGLSPGAVGLLLI